MKLTEKGFRRWKMKSNDPYGTLTADQRVTLKGIISDIKGYRDFLSQKENHNSLNYIHVIAVLWNWRTAINYFLTDDMSYLRIKFS